MDSFPPVSKDLIKALEERFPPHDPSPSDSIEKLMFIGGQRKVIAFLRMRHEDQVETSMIGDRP